jgi:hypothetical protein
MILKSKIINSKKQIPKLKNQNSAFWILDFGFWRLKYILLGFSILLLFNYATCKYSFKDVSIPPEVKTFRVNYLENKARYVNSQLSPQLTEKLKLKIISNTRLHQTNDDSAHFDISGYVSDYSVSTTGISGTTAASNRLTVSFHLIFKNNLDHTKDMESDVTNTFDFDANKTLAEAETGLMDNIVNNTVDAIFNKVFSNW